MLVKLHDRTRHTRRPGKYSKRLDSKIYIYNTFVLKKILAMRDIRYKIPCDWLKVPQEEYGSECNAAGR